MICCSAVSTKRIFVACNGMLWQLRLNVASDAQGPPPAKGMCAAQSHDLLVVEAHAIEDVAQVGGPLGAIRQAAVWGALGQIILVLPARPPLDVRACSREHASGLADNHHTVMMQQDG